MWPGASPGQTKWGGQYGVECGVGCLQKKIWNFSFEKRRFWRILSELVWWLYLDSSLQYGVFIMLQTDFTTETARLLVNMYSYLKFPSQVYHRPMPHTKFICFNITRIKQAIGLYCIAMAHSYGIDRQQQSCSLNSIQSNRDYAFLCSKQDFSLITTVL